jgi:phosphoribulokinase
MAFRAASAEAAKAGHNTFSHFGPEANHFDKIEGMFKQYGETGMCKRRYYVHSEPEAVEHNKHFNLTDLAPGVFTPWEDIEANSDLLFYEGLHGLAVDEKQGIDAGRYDLHGVVPLVNLADQKIHRDKPSAALRRSDRGHQCLDNAHDINFQQCDINCSSRATSRHRTRASWSFASRSQKAWTSRTC